MDEQELREKIAREIESDASNIYWVHYKYSYGEGKGIAEKRGNEYYFFGSEMPDEEKDIVSAIPLRIEIAHSTES
jgi:hypothetical protein